MSLKISDLSFGFKALLFQKINLEIPFDKITAVTGENGSGKTTFCRILSGLQKEFSGSIQIDDQDIKSMSVSEIANQLIYLKQEPQGNIVAATPDEDLSIWQSKFTENLNDQNKIRRMNILSELHIAEFKNTPFWEMSSGQVKRSGMAALLLNPQKFWILDEPFAGLHQEIIDKLIAIILERKKQGFGTLLISHNINEIKEIANRILKIENEQINEI